MPAELCWRYKSVIRCQKSNYFESKICRITKNYYLCATKLCNQVGFDG